MTSTGTFGECSRPSSSPVTNAVDRPPLSDQEEGTSTRVLPLRIPCTRSSDLEESFDPITISADEEDWLCQLVPTKSMEDDSAWLKAMASFPFTSFACVIGQAPCREYYLVGVAASRIQCLRNFGLPLRPLRSMSESDISALWAPSDKEVRTHGVVEARRRSNVAFAQNAAECILSRHTRGLAQCLRGAVDEEHKHLLAPIEWMVLLQDILTAGAGVTKTFVKLCRFLGLLVLEFVPSVSTKSVEAFLGRSDEAWMAIFSRLLSAKTAMAPPTEDMKKEMHQISLLRAVFKNARGGANGFQLRIDGGRSANQNLADLGDLLDIDTESAPVSMGGNDAKHAKDLVMQELGLIFDSEPELGRVCGDVYVNFEMADGSLPQDLLNNLPYESVLKCLCLW